MGCAPLHVLAMKPKDDALSSPKLDIEVADPKRLKPGSKLHEPEFKALLDGNAGFQIRPGIMDENSVSLECNGLFVRSRGKELYLEDYISLHNYTTQPNESTAVAVAR